MPGPDARRLTLEHQAQLAALADDLAKQVRQVVRGANGSAIDLWWLKAFPKLIELVAAFFTAILTLTRQYMIDHAAAEGRVVDPVHAEWSTERVATSLRVMGPVAFKRSISNGRTPEQAINAMAQSLSAAAVRQALAADREMLTATVEAGGEIIGWRRVPDADPCAFCALLVSRGAVYHSGATAGDVRFGGEPYHDNDQCTAEPLYEHEDEPAEVQDLYAAWQRVTAGKSGNDAIRTWREWWDNGGRDDLSTLGQHVPDNVPAPPVPAAVVPDVVPEPDGGPLPVMVRLSALGVPLDADGNPITGEFRNAPTAIREFANELEDLQFQGRGYKVVREAARERLDEIMSWLGDREDLRAGEEDIRNEIEGAAPDTIVQLFRDLAADLEFPPDFSGGHDQREPGDDLLDALIPRTDRQAREQERRIGLIVSDKLNGIYAGLRVEVDNIQVNENTLTFEATIVDQNGMPVGETQREFFREDDGTLFVYHASLTLHPHVQGQGFAEAWNRALMDWYSASGLDRIEVTANIDVGGYTWARQGFDFMRDRDAEQIAYRLGRLLADRNNPFSADQIRAARGMFDRMRSVPFGDPGFPTAYEVSQVGREPGQGKDDHWPGKDAMLGSNWHGVKPVPPRTIEP